MQPSVLLVDDDAFMLGMQSSMLRSMGYGMIGTAISSEAALLTLSNDPQSVDVIICDLNMPGMDGVEFLQRLAASAFFGSVILLSGEGMRVMHTVQKLLGTRLVVLGALEKPAGRTALQALLDRWTPLIASAPSVEAPPFTADEVHTANRLRQWVLHYQPKVDLRTGAFAGAEALVRCNHPDYGLVAPDRFIRTAEECGAIDSLTGWVLQAAIEQQACWQSAGLKMRMAVNVSMDNLRAPGFAHRVGDLVRNKGTSPQDFTLEVTESRLLSPSPVPLENLVRLRLQRFGLSIDDFGTGHSSLAHLRDVPFTELKVDRSFVHNARHNQIIRPILEGSLGLAKRLGMQAVAEGVESEDDWHLLREIGCDIGQGYLIGRPMPSARIPQWLDQWQTRRASLVLARE
ncbi:MAG: EAL domain-containing protein [Gammaproteobacteria bacterium]